LSLSGHVAVFTTVGEWVQVGGVLQVSGVTPNDYWGTLTYAVIGADQVRKDYRVTVTEDLAWANRAPPGIGPCEDIASSSDGKKLALCTAGAGGGDIWTSADSGLTWTDQKDAGTRSWQALAGSADGIRLVAREQGAGVWTSSNSGATWKEHADAPGWGSLACSSDGMTIAAFGGSSVWTSVDFGDTWTEHVVPGPCALTAIAISADGAKLAV
jgi:hypothetical protein